MLFLKQIDLKPLKKKIMTYEECMNFFIKYPNHSKTLHRVFSPIVVTLTIFIGVFTLNKFFEGTTSFALLTACISTGFVFSKILLVQNMLNGHGVGIKKKGRFQVLGLTEKVFWKLLVPFILILIMNILAFMNDDLEFPKDAMRFRLFVVSILFVYIMSMLCWRFHIYYETWYGDEYKARVEFKNRGDSDEEIERKIEILYKQGTLYKDA